MSSTANHGRRGRPWRRIREQVLREEPWCYWCGAPSTVVDHLIPISLAPELAHERSNLRGSCKPCNLSKGTRPAPKRRRIIPTTQVTQIEW